MSGNVLNEVPSVVSFTSLGAGYICILVSSLEFCSRISYPGIINPLETFKCSQEVIRIAFGLGLRLPLNGAAPF